MANNHNPEPREIEGLPSLASLLARLALSQLIGKNNHPEQFRNDALSVMLPRPMASRQQRYAELCGESGRDKLPFCYPQVLASPLMYELLLGQSFPFKMLGLIHTSHQVRAHDLIPSDAQLRLTCATYNLQPTNRGYTFQLGSQIHNERSLLWESEATFLFRSKEPPIARERTTKSADSADEKNFSRAAILELDANLGRRYANVSMDYNPIHLSPLTAKLFGFRQPIAHGLWLLGWVSAVLKDVTNVRIEFKAPIFLPNNIVLETRLSGKDGEFRVKAHKGLRTYATGTFQLS